MTTTIIIITTATTAMVLTAVSGGMPVGMRTCLLVSGTFVVTVILVCTFSNVAGIYPSLKPAPFNLALREPGGDLSMAHRKDLNRIVPCR